MIYSFYQSFGDIISTSVFLDVGHFKFKWKMIYRNNLQLAELTSQIF